MAGPYSNDGPGSQSIDYSSGSASAGGGPYSNIGNREVAAPTYQRGLYSTPAGVISLEITTHIFSATLPTTRTDGGALETNDLWIDTTSNTISRYDGTAFIEISTAEATNIIVSDTAPTTRTGGAALEDGDLWIDSADHNIAVYSSESGSFVDVRQAATVVSDGVTIEGDGDTTPLAVRDGGISDAKLASTFVKTVNSMAPDAAGDVTIVIPDTGPDTYVQDISYNSATGVVTYTPVTGGVVQSPATFTIPEEYLASAVLSNGDNTLTITDADGNDIAITNTDTTYGTVTQTVQGLDVCC